MSRLKELRGLNNYTQEDVASYMGITRAAYTNIENGKRQRDEQTIRQLSELYNVSAGCILGMEPIPSDNKEQLLANSEELDNSLVSMLVDLNPQDVQLVQDFVEWLKGVRTRQSSETP